MRRWWRPHIAAGRLVSVLGRYCDPFPGYWLHYASTRKTAALTAFIDAVRIRK